MCDQDIEGASVINSVQVEARQELKCPLVGFSLGILIHSIGSVADGPAQAADQKFFVANQFQVQV